MLTTRFFVCFAILISSAVASLAQAHQEGPHHLSERNVRNHRVAVTAGVGVLPTFWSGSQQERPAMQATVQYYLSERLAVGVAYANTITTSRELVDGQGVGTTQRSSINHYGARLNGSIVRRGPFELYGGLQVGANFTDATQTYSFPEDAGIENRESYIAEKTDPFAAPRGQVSATGFFGATLRIVQHVHVMAEIGNNFSLLTTGLEIRL